MRLIVLFIVLWVSPVWAQEDDLSYMESDISEPITADVNRLDQETEVAEGPEANDPMEDFNRVIFGFNDVLDTVILNPIAFVYTTIFPESLVHSISCLLRNLNEPIVFANNLLQGDIEGARVTLGRFLVNSTAGIGGLLDLSETVGLPYEKQDFGLTLASWGMDAGPYMVLPLLGPSNVRDTCGRLGDYLLDPINWWAYFTTNNAPYSYGRTGAQIIAVRAENLAILKRLKEDSLDYYATTRAWYMERRESLRRRDLIAQKKEMLESPSPDDDDEEDATS